MAGYVSTQQYVWGLHRMLDGITASADSTPPEHLGRVGTHHLDGPGPRRHQRAVRLHTTQPVDRLTHTIGEIEQCAGLAFGGQLPLGKPIRSPVRRHRARPVLVEPACGRVHATQPTKSTTPARADRLGDEPRRVP
jgi:hypothetical protein